MKDNTGKIPLQYFGLSREDKKRQLKALKKSRKGYKTTRICSKTTPQIF